MKPTAKPSPAPAIRHYDGGEPRLSFDYMEPGEVRPFIATQAATIEGLRTALSDLLADAEAMDARLLVGQPAPGCEKGSIARARAALLSNLPAALDSKLSNGDNAMREALNEVLGWTEGDLASAGDSGNITLDEDIVNARVAHLNKVLA